MSLVGKGGWRALNKLIRSAGVRPRVAVRCHHFESRPLRDGSPPRRGQAPVRARCAAPYAPAGNPRATLSARARQPVRNPAGSRERSARKLPVFPRSRSLAVAGAARRRIPPPPRPRRAAAGTPARFPALVRGPKLPDLIPRLRRPLWTQHSSGDVERRQQRGRGAPALSASTLLLLRSPRRDRLSGSMSTEASSMATLHSRTHALFGNSCSSAPVVDTLHKAAATAWTNRLPA